MGNPGSVYILRLLVLQLTVHISLTNIEYISQEPGLQSECSD